MLGSRPGEPASGRWQWHFVFSFRIYQIFTRGGLRGKANPASETRERQRPFAVKSELSWLRFQLQAAWIPGSGEGQRPDRTAPSSQLHLAGGAESGWRAAKRDRDLKEARSWTLRRWVIADILPSWKDRWQEATWLQGSWELRGSSTFLSVPSLELVTFLRGEEGLGGWCAFLWSLLQIAMFKKQASNFSSTQVSLNCNIKLVWTQDCHVKVMLLLGKVKESFVLVPCFSDMPLLFL